MVSNVDGGPHSASLMSSSPPASGHERAVFPDEDHELAAFPDEDLDQDSRSTDKGMPTWLAGSSTVVAAVLFITSASYEATTKGLAKSMAAERGEPFDAASILIGMSTLAIIIGTVLSAATGQLSLLVNRDTFRRLARYSVPGVLFAVTGYLQFAILNFIPIDVFKVLEQSRLLLLGLSGWVVFGHKPSRTAWALLVVITLGAALYATTSQAEKKIQIMEGVISKLQSGEEAAEPPKVYQFMKGVCLSAVFVCLQCIASVWSEYWLKEDKHLPFYIQKVYLEIPGLITAMLMAMPFMSEVLVKIHLKKDASSPSCMSGNFFIGWNWMVVIQFFFYNTKSWGSGVLIKMMSSLVKQLCSVVVTGIVYFLVLIHARCPKEGEDRPLFCPSNLASATMSMTIADFAVVSAVIAYALLRSYEDKAAQTLEELKERFMDNDGWGCEEPAIVPTKLPSVLRVDRVSATKLRSDLGAEILSAKASGTSLAELETSEGEAAEVPSPRDGGKGIELAECPSWP